MHQDYEAGAFDGCVNEDAEPIRPTSEDHPFQPHLPPLMFASDTVRASTGPPVVAAALEMEYATL